MPVIDLKRYIVSAAGTWTDPSGEDPLFRFSRAETMSSERLLLRWPGDFVALTGPLRVQVTVQAENMTIPLAYVGNMTPSEAILKRTEKEESGNTGNASWASIFPKATLTEDLYRSLGHKSGMSLQASTIYSYTLDIAAGQAWPFSLSEQLDAMRLRETSLYSREQLGHNLGHRVIIEPAFTVAKQVPCTTHNDLPCDFAVADQPHTASFFPVGCEPCGDGVVGLPPMGSVSLVTQPAAGGCVRTRFFDGMFITREDLETEQRYNRLKSKLHNRASGAGVVWGLAVGKSGSHICVSPGYGVDCCGNDLALTSLYKVEVAALVADPAIARLRYEHGPQRVSLLLEYVECPSAPRPVHGDPCSPKTSRCEMSRIRESVRLRLVPPRTCDTKEESSPIARFLEEVRELRTRYATKQSGSSDPAAGAFKSKAPFVVNITGSSDNAEVATASVRPSTENDAATLNNSKLIGAAWDTVKIQMQPDAQWTFVGGTTETEARQAERAVTVDAPRAAKLATEAAPSRNTIETSISLAQATETPDTVIYKLRNLQAQHILANRSEPGAASDVTLTFKLDTDRKITAIDYTYKPTIITARKRTGPCDAEPCTPWDAEGESRKGTPLPWLHADPVHPESAGDPKVILLAALGGWLTQAMVTEREEDVKSSRVTIAKEIYRLTWLLLFGLSRETPADELGRMLQRLLEEWCHNLLWKGPECCGDPHGVVIGCAILEGETLHRIDPFGGRRHVVHYPLLEHWGTQFGIAPPDLTASSFFSKLCCIASLPSVDGRGILGGKASQVEIGQGVLLYGDSASVKEALAKENAEARRVGLPEMIASVVTLMQKRGSENVHVVDTTKANDTTTDTGSTSGRFRSALVLADVVADHTVVLLMPND
jgi:hypothetical protein